MSEPHRGDILLVRHGRAFSNDAEILAGPSCQGLTREGVTQAQTLGRWLAYGPPITRLFSSTTLRAQQTARIISRHSGLTTEQLPDLRVPDPGSADGMTWNQARARWPCPSHAVLAPPAPDAETWSDYLVRSMRQLREVFDTHDGARTVVVGHSETLSSVLCMLLATGDLARLRLKPHHCAVTIWRPAGGLEHSPRGRLWALTEFNYRPNADSPA